MIGINTVTLVGRTDRAKVGKSGAARFWLNTSVKYTNRDGAEKVVEDSVIVFSPAFPKNKDGSPIKDGSLVMVVGELANAEVARQGQDALKFVQVVAESISRVEPDTAHVNRLIWAAGLGADPEMRFTAAGAEVTTLRMVVGGNRETGEPGVWIDGTLWRGQAKYANDVLRKGSRITVEGRVATEEWTSKDGAKSGLKTRCHINDFLVWEPPTRRQDEGAAPARGNGRNVPAPVVADDGIFEETANDGEDVPF